MFTKSLLHDDLVENADKNVTIQIQEEYGSFPYQNMTDGVWIFCGFWWVNISCLYFMVCKHHESTLSIYDKIAYWDNSPILYTQYILSNMSTNIANSIEHWHILYASMYFNLTQFPSPIIHSIWSNLLLTKEITVSRSW